MISLPNLLTALRDQSVRRWGFQRAAASTFGELVGAMRQVDQDPSNLLLWVNLITSAMEGAMASGNTPYAVSQAMVNKLRELESARVAPPLPHVPGGGGFDS